MTEKRIYLDNSATTAPSPGVAQRMLETLNIFWGNPSSVHACGMEANKLLQECRQTILSAFGIKNPSAGMLVFTGSGTEADNLALTGVLTAKHRSFLPRVIITNSEHPAVSEPVSRMEREGMCEVVRLSTRGGVLDMGELQSALNDRTVLVSLMTVNNETGAAYDVKEAFRLVRETVPSCITHTDAVQAFGKLPVLPEKLHADLVTVSAHKINGPKGVGALYMNPALLRKKQLSPVIWGGGQENGLRSGTENMPGIAGFAEAVREKQASGARLSEHMTMLREYLISRLPPEVHVNVPNGAYWQGIVSLTLPGIKSEVMLRYLSAENICVSSGSACSSHHKTASPVLLAFGLTEREADCTLRISMGAENTEEELSRFSDVLRAGLSRLVRMR